MHLEVWIHGDSVCRPLHRVQVAYEIGVTADRCEMQCGGSNVVMDVLIRVVVEQ